MKNVRIVKLLFLGLMFVGFLACQKDVENEIIITLDSNIEGQNFESGDKVEVQGTIEATETEISAYSIIIENIDTGNEVLSVSKNTSSSSVFFFESWTNDVADHSDMKLTITGTDNEGKTERLTASFHAHP